MLHPHKGKVIMHSNKPDLRNQTRERLPLYFAFKIFILKKKLMDQKILPPNYVGSASTSQTLTSWQNCFLTGFLKPTPLNYWPDKKDSPTPKLMPLVKLIIFCCAISVLKASQWLFLNILIDASLFLAPSSFSPWPRKSIEVRHHERFINSLNAARMQSLRRKHVCRGIL